MSDQPPLFDVSGLAAEDDAPALAQLAGPLAEACEQWGLFHVVGHGLSTDDLASFDAAMRALFALPVATKRRLRRTRDNAWGWFDAELTKNRRDWKEIFDYGPEWRSEDRARRGSTGGEPPAHSDGRNRWPDAAPALRDALVAHHRACAALALRLVRALCVSLGLPADTLDAAFRTPTSFQRLNRYVPCPDPAPADAARVPEQGELGVHHHTDAGALTILYQDDVGGLQAYPAGDDARPVSIEPVPGALTVNLGDMFQIWSNDRYRSPVHRVLAPEARTRFSAPFFLNPGYDVVCAPLPALLEHGDPARFRAVSWAHFRDRRSAGDYADTGPEIQVDDFRIA